MADINQWAWTRAKEILAKGADEHSIAQALVLTEQETARRCAEIADADEICREFRVPEGAR